MAAVTAAIAAAIAAQNEATPRLLAAYYRAMVANVADIAMVLYADANGVGTAPQAVGAGRFFAWSWSFSAATAGGTIEFKLLKNGVQVGTTGALAAGTAIRGRFVFPAGLTYVDTDDFSLTYTTSALWVVRTGVFHLWTV